MASTWWNLTKGTWKATNSMSQAMQGAVNDARNNRLSSGARRGVLGPWDPPPPPRAHQAGLWDYRGVARTRDIAHATADFPLGRYVDPRHWRTKQTFGLPAQVANEHTVVIGPTRSGKTVSIIAPWIHSALQLGYTVVAVDVKGNDDLLREIKTYSAARGRLGVPVLKWDYTDPARSMSWNWIADVCTEGQINAAVEAICGRPSPQDPNKFFHQSAIKYLRGILQLASAAAIPMTLRDILAVLSDPAKMDGFVRSRLGHPGAHRLVELTGLGPGDFIKHTMELKTHLETLDTNGFSAVTRPSSAQFRFDDLAGTGPALIIVNAPMADGALADAACSLFLSQLLQRLLTNFNQRKRSVLLALDEGPRVQHRIDLGSTLSLVAGAGASVLLACQDVTQFQPDVRDEILSNCGTMVCLPRVSKATTDYFSGRLGQMNFGSMSHNVGGRGGFGQPGSTWTHSTVTGAVLAHREISSPPPLLGCWPGFVHAPSLSARPVVVDLDRADLH